MSTDLELLGELNSVLAQYAQVLTATGARSQRANEALRRVYDLQARSARTIYLLLESAEPTIGIRHALLDPAFQTIKDALEQSKHPQVDLDTVLIEPILSGDFDRLYTILGPNKFPDDDPEPTCMPHPK